MKRYIICGLGSLCVSAYLHAVPVYTTTAVATVDGVPVDSESDGPEIPDDLPAWAEAGTGIGVDFDWNDDDLAVGAANVLGHTVVDATGLWASPNAGDLFGLTATAATSELVVNTTGDSQKATYEFFVYGPKLILYGGGNPFQAQAPRATYSMSILLDGTTIWSSKATYKGGNSGRSLTQSGTDLNPTYSENSGEHTLTFEDYGSPLAPEVLVLGILAPGESFTLETMLIADVSAGPFELGASASVIDPGDVNGGFGGTVAFSPTGPAGVPDGGTSVALLGLSLLGLTGLRKCRC